MKRQGPEGGRRKGLGVGGGEQEEGRKEESESETSHINEKGRGRQGLHSLLKASSLTGVRSCHDQGMRGQKSKRSVASPRPTPRS